MATPAAPAKARPQASTSRRLVEALRFPVSFVLALVLTASMFLLLNTVISNQIEVGEQKVATKIDFSRLRRDSEIKMIKREKPKPVEQTEPPPDAPKIAAPDAAAQAPSAGPIAIGPGAGLNVDVKSMLGGPGGLGVGGVGGGGSDRAEMPLVRIQPEYPPRALARGIEGWAVIEFSVTATGTTKDVKAVESDPPGVFDQAAIKAVQSWRYNPKIQDGTAVERRGMRVMLTFKIAQ